jgi:hypothetical protein
MKYYWTYEEELMLEDKAFPLKVGDITHILIYKQDTGQLDLTDLMSLTDFIQKRYPENSEEVTHEIAEQAISLLGAYIKEAQKTELKLISSELHLETEEPDFFIYGRIDSLGRDGSDYLWRVEHKTTARLDSYFLSGLKSDLQSGIYYHLLDRTLKESVKGTIFNLLVKTKVPYCQINPVLRSKVIQDRALKAFEGVARSIKRGDIYPSGECFDYGRECDFYQLCNHPTEEVKQAFYKKRERKN